MPSSDVEGLTASGTLTGTELLYADNGSADVKVTSEQIRAFGFQRDTVQATTSGTAINFTSIPSWARRITVVFDGVSLSGSDHLLIQIGVSGGLETTGYTSNSTRFTNAAGITEVTSTTGYVIMLTNATAAAQGMYVLTNITGNTWVGGWHGGSTGLALGMTGGGSKTLAGTITRVTITRTGSNTFDAGQVNVMWE